MFQKHCPWIMLQGKLDRWVSITDLLQLFLLTYNTLLKKNLTHSSAAIIINKNAWQKKLTDILFYMFLCHFTAASWSSAESCTSTSDSEVSQGRFPSTVSFILVKGSSALLSVLGRNLGFLSLLPHLVHHKAGRLLEHH